MRQGLWGGFGFSFFFKPKYPIYDTVLRNADCKDSDFPGSLLAGSRGRRGYRAAQRLLYTLLSSNGRQCLSALVC